MSTEKTFNDLMEAYEIGCPHGEIARLEHWAGDDLARLETLVNAELQRRVDAFTS